MTDHKDSKKVHYNLFELVEKNQRAVAGVLGGVSSPEAQAKAKHVMREMFDEAKCEILDRRMSRLETVVCASIFTPLGVARFLPDSGSFVFTDPGSLLSILFLNWAIITAAAVVTVPRVFRLMNMPQMDPAKDYAVNPDAKGHQKVYEEAQRKVNDYIANKVGERATSNGPR